MIFCAPLTVPNIPMEEKRTLWQEIATGGYLRFLGNLEFTLEIRSAYPPAQDKLIADYPAHVAPAIEPSKQKNLPYPCAFSFQGCFTIDHADTYVHSIQFAGSNS